MVTALSLVLIFVFLIASYLDLRYKAIPSIFLTIFIFIVLIANPENLFFGVLAFVFSILIGELIGDVAGLDFGIADKKLLTIIGLMISTMHGFVIMLIVFMIFQFVYVTVWRYKTNEKEIPFIPCLTAIYIFLLIVGVIT